MDLGFAFFQDRSGEMTTLYSVRTTGDQASNSSAAAPRLARGPPAASPPFRAAGGAGRGASTTSEIAWSVL
jgi:hypothetical protein